MGVRRVGSSAGSRYWDEVERAVDEFRLPRWKVKEPGSKRMRTSAVELTEEQTRGLLQEVPRAYRTRINEVLLTALGRALSKWSGRRQVVVELEGHGREEIAEGVGAEVRGAVGWFTSVSGGAGAKWDEAGESLKKSRSSCAGCRGRTGLRTVALSQWQG